MYSSILQKIALFVGIILIVIAVVLLMEDLSSVDIFPVVLGLLGIFVIGVFFPKQEEKVASIKQITELQ